MLKLLDRCMPLAVLACAIFATSVAYGDAPTSHPAGQGRMILGNAVLEPQRDSLSAGRSEAFRLRAHDSGLAGMARIYIDRKSTARTIIVGVYDDANGQPGSLLSTGSISASRGGSWTTVALAPTRLVSNRTYWLTILSMDGTLRFRDRHHRRCHSDESASASLNKLPASWHAGRVHARTRCAVSAYILEAAGAASAPIGLITLPGPTSAPGLTSPTVPTLPALPPPVKTSPPSAPTNITAPSISPASATPREGETLTATTGTWTGSPTYAYQWEDCEASGRNCFEVSGATGSSYMLASGDVGRRVRVKVTATNAGGHASATSAETNKAGAKVKPPPPPPPTNTAPPVISGTTTQGQELSSTEGEWSGNPTSYTYQWQDCDGSGKNCTDISEATASSYTLIGSDVGNTIRVVVTAINAGGSKSSTSDATAVIAPPASPPPVNTMLPVISGTTTQGQVLSSTKGEWSGNPTSYTYQWQDCSTSGNKCLNVSGAKSSSYTLTESDVGHTLRVIVTATNAGGSTPATSAHTGEVSSAPVEEEGPPEEGTPYPPCTQTIGAGTNVSSAVSSAAGGSVICLSSGSYGSLTLSSTAASDVTLQAAPAAHVTSTGIGISGSHLVVRGLWITGEVTLEAGASHITIDRDDISQGGEGIVFNTSDCTVPNAPKWPGCEPHAPVTNVVISDNHIHDIGQPGTEDAIHLDNWRNVTVTGNEFDHIIESGNHTDCLQSVYGGSELTFTHNYEHDNDCQGFFVKDGDVNDVSFTDNLFLRDNEPDGKGERFGNLAQFWNIQGLTIEHNTIWDGKGIVLVTEEPQNSPSATIDHNLFSYFSISTPIGKAYTIAENHNIFAEAPETLSLGPTDSVNSKPQFDSTATDDYRLASNPNGIGIDWRPAEKQYGPSH